MTNQLVIHLAKELKRTAAKNNAPIWKKIAEFALKPSSARRVININKISKLTKENDVIVFPGKVLGTGTMTHKISLCSFSISNTAAKKIKDNGGKILTFETLEKSFPTGKGVVILG